MGGGKRALAAVVACGLAAIAVGCGDDSGGGSGGGGGAGTGTGTGGAPSQGPGGQGGFTLNDVTFDVYEGEDVVMATPVFFHIGWIDCPEDCQTTSFTVNGVALGTPESWLALTESDLLMLRDAILADGKVTIATDGPAGAVTFDELPCPGIIEITAPPIGQPIALPGDLTVTWTVPDGAEGGVVTEAQFDEDLAILGGPDAIAQVTNTETQAVLNLPDAYPDSELSVLSVAYGGTLVKFGGGAGEGSCTRVHMRSYPIE